MGQYIPGFRPVSGLELRGKNILLHFSGSSGRSIAGNIWWRPSALGTLLSGRTCCWGWLVNLCGARLLFAFPPWLILNDDNDLCGCFCVCLCVFMFSVCERVCVFSFPFSFSSVACMCVCVCFLNDGVDLISSFFFYIKGIRL